MHTFFRAKANLNKKLARAEEKAIPTMHKLNYALLEPVKQP